MPASISTLQIPDVDIKDFIAAIVWAETENLLSELEVSIYDCGHSDRWDLVIRDPKGKSAISPLFASRGDFALSAFRTNLRELLERF